MLICPENYAMYFLHINTRVKQMLNMKVCKWICARGYWNVLFTFHNLLLHTENATHNEVLAAKAFNGIDCPKIGFINPQM